MASSLVSCNGGEYEMTQGQQFFIQILSDFIHEKKSMIPDELNMDELMRYGKLHEMMGIIYHQTGLPQFQTAFFYTMYTSKNRRRLLDELTAEFDFPWFLVKGTEVAELYPIPELRTMGDCDIVIHSQDREVAHGIFLKQGFENKSKYPDREWQYYKMNMEFELHDHLIYTENVNNPKQEIFFNNFWKYVSDNKLDWNFHFLYLVSHLRKHFMNEGVGFRPFVDLTIIINRVDLDWDWIEEYAEKTELRSFLRTVLAFCSRWFQIEVPIGITELDEDFYEVSTRRIFENGIFGYNNEDNGQSDMINLYRKRGRLGAFDCVVKEIFIPYRLLSNVPKYSFVKGRPYLTSVAWIYRIFSERKNIGHKVLSLKKYFVSSEKIEKREDMYSRWGL